MKHPIDPKETSRAQAFTLWMKSPMPMVTLTKTLDITTLVRFSKRKGYKFNMLMCWCIGKAANSIDEFFIIPESGELMQYDTLAINTIVKNNKGGINSCDVPYCEDLVQFSTKYNNLTDTSATTCESSFIPESIIVGTSALVQTELDCIVNQYTELFLNPMVMWGRYRKRFFRYTLPISFQFHHVQMDGAQAALFLERLQQAMNCL